VTGRYSNPPRALERVTERLATWARTDRTLLPMRPPIKIIFRLGPEAIKNLSADYLAGASTGRLARDYGIAKSSVNQVLRREGIELRGRGNLRPDGQSGRQAQLARREHCDRTRTDESWDAP
jgi:hypothetical protein